MIRTVLSQYFNKEISIPTEAERTAEPNTRQFQLTCQQGICEIRFFVCLFTVLLLWCQVWDAISIQQPLGCVSSDRCAGTASRLEVRWHKHIVREALGMCTSGRRGGWRVFLASYGEPTACCEEL